MTVEFDIDKIVKYLVRFKSNLPNLYNWNAKNEQLIELETLTEEEVTLLLEEFSWKAKQMSPDFVPTI